MDVALKNEQIDLYIISIGRKAAKLFKKYAFESCLFTMQRAEISRDDHAPRVKRMRAVTDRCFSLID